MPEVLLAAEVLQVQVLYPDGDDFFIRQVAGVYQTLQADLEPDRAVRPVNASSVQAAKALLECGPVDLLSQLQQGVAQVDDDDQFLAEQVNLHCVGRLASRYEFARFGAGLPSIPAISAP